MGVQNYYNFFLQKKSCRKVLQKIGEKIKPDFLFFLFLLIWAYLGEWSKKKTPLKKISRKNRGLVLFRPLTPTHPPTAGVTDIFCGGVAAP
jgi:hypothetical protein